MSRVRARGRTRYRETVGLCLALVACGGISTIGSGPGSGGSNGTSSAAPALGETCGHVQCGAYESCCLATLECFDPAAHPEACPVPPDTGGAGWYGPDCASNAHCPANEVCEPDVLCGGPGHCFPPADCAQCVTGDCPLCACDGKSYPNYQAACVARTSPGHMGLCGTTFGVTYYLDDPKYGISGLDANAPYARYQITVCGSDADCPREGEVCCGLTAVCYPKSDPGQCAFPPPGTFYPCTSNAQCPSEYYCAGEGCGTPGGCAVIDTAARGCGELFDPVCGCDGVGYTSPLCALQAGTRVASKGACP